MSTSSSIGISAVKPCCRILIRYRSSSIFGVSATKSNSPCLNNSSKSRFKHAFRRGYGKPGFSGHLCAVDPGRRAFCISDSSWGQSRVGSCRVNGRRGLLVIPRVASDFRNHSTSIEAHVNQKSFESIYIQGGLNVKPLVIERIETDQGIAKEEERNRIEADGSTVNIDSLKGLQEKTVEREVSEIEKEAWKLLRSAVVNYCGNSVGTVAANDLLDKQALNYDQVFIRDFVPSALAFLLNGEGEIVKNFLLHTLQLQVPLCLH